MDVLEVQACKGLNLSFEQEINTANEYTSEIEKTWEIQLNSTKESKSIPIIWTNNASDKSNKIYMNLSRVMVAVLTNCIQYAHPQKGISVHVGVEMVKNDERNWSKLQLFFVNWQDEKSNGLSEWHNNIRRESYSPVPLGGHLHGKEFIEIYVKELNGTDDFPEDSKQDPYELKIEIPWR